MVNYDLFEITQDGLRLDEVVHSYYGNLTMFDKVIEVNPYINRVYLSIGDKVRLPPVIIVKKADVLW